MPVFILPAILDLSGQWLFIFLVKIVIATRLKEQWSPQSLTCDDMGVDLKYNRRLATATSFGQL